MTTQSKVLVVAYVASAALLVSVSAVPLKLSMTAQFAALLVAFLSLAILFGLIRRLKNERLQKEEGQPQEVVRGERSRLREAIKRNRVIQIIGIVLIGILAPSWMPILNPGLQPMDCYIASISTLIIAPAIVWFATRKKLRELE